MAFKVHLQGSNITFEREDVIIGANQLALLADIDRVVTIEPGRYAQIAVPIVLTGDGKSIALIDMHAGRLSHTMNEYEENTPQNGEYFLPAPDVEQQVTVDVINETRATIMIRPGTRIGIMTVVNVAGAEEAETYDADAEGVPQKFCFDILVKFDPKNIPEVDHHAHTKEARFELVADIPEPAVILPGEGKIIPTGTYAEIPQGLASLLRMARTLPLGAFLTEVSSEEKELQVHIQNTTRNALSISPGAEIAQLAFVPVLAGLN